MAVQPAQQPVVMTRRLFTVDEYYRMAEAEILRPDERLELIEGEIVEISPIGDRHYSRVIVLSDVFQDGLGKVVIVVAQAPVRLARRVEPEPDLAIVRRRPDRYASGKPGPADIFLLIEVADSSLQYDREIKAPLYARYGVQEVWIVDLIHDAIEVYRDPSPDGYRSVRVYPRGESIQPLAFPNLTVHADDILS